MREPDDNVDHPVYPGDKAETLSRWEDADEELQQLDETLETLEDIRENMRELATRIRMVEVDIEGGARLRLQQVRAQIEQALGDEHEWLGGSMYTLDGVINELQTGEV